MCSKKSEDAELLLRHLTAAVALAVAVAVAVAVAIVEVPQA